MIAGARGNFTRKDVPVDLLEPMLIEVGKLTERDGLKRVIYIRPEEGDRSVWWEREDRVGPINAQVFMTVEKQ